MNRQGWFGWTVVRHGSDTSGNYQHRGRKGKKGGSLPGGGHGAIGIGVDLSEQDRRKAVQEYRQKQRDKKTAKHPVAGTLEEAKKQSIGRQEIINHIVATNPPKQVKSGKVTAEEWAKEYMSDSDQEFALVQVHPEAMHFPAEVDLPKVGAYAQQTGQPPPIVVDSNQKMEARFGGGKLERAYGRQPHTVIDGKHRAKAALEQGASSIRAYVPKGKLGEIWQRSHEIERSKFAREYLKKKGFPLLEETGAGWKVDRQGQERTYTPRDIERIARNTGHEWTWGQ